jgi:hypothetical protein
LDPLTVEDIALASWDAFNGLSTDQAAVEATCFQLLEQWNPIDTRGFHRDRLDATVDKPVRQCLEISSVRTKRPHDLLVITVGHAGHDLMGANVDTRSVGGNLAHAREGTGFTLRGSGTTTFAELAHGLLLCQTKM